MAIQVPGGASFDGHRLVPGVPCGVTAAAGAHPPLDQPKPVLVDAWRSCPAHSRSPVCLNLTFPVLSVSPVLLT